jgi:hypothetical protein
MCTLLRYGTSAAEFIAVHLNTTEVSGTPDPFLKELTAALTGIEAKISSLEQEKKEKEQQQASKKRGIPLRSKKSILSDAKNMIVEWMEIYEDLGRYDFDIRHVLTWRVICCSGVLTKFLI